MTDFDILKINSYKTQFQRIITIKNYPFTASIPPTIDDALSFINYYLTTQNPNINSIVSLLEDIHQIHTMKICSFYPRSYEYITDILNFFIKTDKFGFNNTVEIVDSDGKVIDFTKITVDKCEGYAFMKYETVVYWSSLNRDITDDREASEIMPQKRRKFEIEPISDETLYNGINLFEKLFKDYFVS